MSWSQRFGLGVGGVSGIPVADGLAAQLRISR